MPSSVLHSYFAIDTISKANPKIANKIDINYLKIFAQGPDIYYFYNLMIGKKANNIKNIGIRMHKTNTQQYFLELIKYIVENNLKNNKQIMSYLYGSIAHYILDSTTHPFIIYHAGIFNSKNRKTYKYSSLHFEIEYYLDAYFIFKREKMLPKDFKVYNYLVNVNNIDKELIKMINTIMAKVYKVENFAPYYIKGINDMKKFYHIFNYDKYGIKKVLYKIIDFFSPRCFTKKAVLSFHINPYEKDYILNSDKEEWNHPMDSDEFYNLSFVEIYLSALTKCISIINAVDDMLNKNEYNLEKLKELFPNLSYLTGKDCNDSRTMKYFKDNKTNILL